MGPAAAVLASSDQGSWGREVAWRRLGSGTAPAGWGTARLVHTAAHRSLAAAAVTTNILPKCSSGGGGGMAGVQSTFTHLSWIRPLHALHAHSLLPRPWIAPLLGHPLAVGPKGPHALAPGLVHSHGGAAHGGAAHGGRVHSTAHVPRKGRRSAGPRLVHELAVVPLVWRHLEGGTHLEDETSSVSGRVHRRCSRKSR